MNDGSEESLPHLRTAPFRIVALAAGLVLLGRAANAATPLMALRYAADISVVLDGTTITPADVADDDLVAGTVVAVDIGDIPADAHVDAYERLPNGDQLLSFDTTLNLPGGVIATPPDVVRFNGATFAVEFDGAANGIPQGVNTDAVAVSDGDLLLSFDTSVQLDGTTFEDEDLVLFSGGQFVPFFTGRDAGVPADLDLDSAQVLAPKVLLLSFDGSGTVGSVTFDDDDILEYDAGSDSWELAFQGTRAHAELADADVVAVYGIAVPPSPTATATVSPSLTPSATAPATETPVNTPTATEGPPATATLTPVSTETVTPVPTETETRVPTQTATVMPTGTGTPVSTQTGTMVPTETGTPVPTQTGTAVPTETGTAVSTETPTPTVTGTPPSTETASVTSTATASATETAPPSITPTSTSGPGVCVGDCNNSGEVTINELIIMVNIALGSAPVEDCLPGDANGDGQITIDEIILAVNHALDGC